MLLYQPPFLVVDRLTLYPDHLDPDTFYYLVSVPELVREGDRPAFWATAILEAVSVSGTGTTPAADVARLQLSFDVALAATQAELDKAAEELKQRRGREKVKLAPAALTDGKAELVVARPTTPDADKQLFVYTGHPPSLIGDDRAAFAVAAAGDEARIVAASIQHGDLAAVVAYELSFLGLVPAFEAKMTVHWSMIYSHLSERSIDNYVFYSDQLDTTVDELTKTNAIEVEITELDPDVKAEAARALFDQLKAQIVDKMFEPAFTAGDEPIEERIGRGVREVLSSIMPGRHHALRKLDQTALSDTTVDLREQAARTYKHDPQSTLAGMLARAGGAPPLAVVRLDELPDRIEEWRVDLAPGSDDLGIAEVLVWVQADVEEGVPPVEASYTFAPGAAAQVFRFRRHGQTEPSVRWRAELAPARGFAPDGDGRWPTDWTPATGGRVYVDPRAWIDVRTVRLEIDDPAMFALPATAEVQVTMRLRDAAEPFRVDDLVFDVDHPSRTCSVIARRGEAVVLTAVEVLRRPNEPEVRRDVGELTGPVHRITNPFAAAWRMELHAAADWTATQALVAELRVWEPARAIWLRDEHRFTADATAYVLAFATSPDTPQAAEVRLTRITPAADVIRGPWMDLAGKVARVTDHVEAKRRVRVRLAAPGFADDHVRRVTVELSVDLADGSVASTSLVFAHDGQALDWTYDQPDPARVVYRWRASAISEDQERWSHPTTEATDDDLTVELPVHPFTE